MRKNSISIITMALVAGCFMFSCSKETGNEEQPIKGTKILIPAETIGTKAVDANGKATFKTTENVYIAKTGVIDANVLHPSASGASTTFTGTLAGEYSVGNHITVLYNTNASGVVDYSGQDGSIEGVKDAGWAEDVEIVSYSGGILTTAPVTLDNLQSIFKFTFINASTSAEISGVRSVQISSKDNKLFSSYDVIEPSSSNSTYGAITVSRSTDLAVNYFCAALRFDTNNKDVINFEVVDKDGNVYRGSKTAPSGGFSNGVIYTTSVDVSKVYTTLSALKSAINAPGANITELRSTYVCKYIDEDGKIHDTKGTEDVGIIAYLGNEDLIWNPTSSNKNYMSWNSSNINFTGRRVFITAISSDITATWNDLSNFGITGFGTSVPTGSTPWFVPSRSQMEEYIGLVNPRTGAGAELDLHLSSDRRYWSSTQQNTTQGKAYRPAHNTWENTDKGVYYYVLPCCAY